MNWYKKATEEIKPGTVLKYSPGSPYKGEFKILEILPDGSLKGIDVISSRSFTIKPDQNGKFTYPDRRGNPTLPLFQGISV